MKICTTLIGASAPFVEGLIAALGEHNRLWYREHRRAPGPLAAGVRYVDELPSDTIDLVDAPTLIQIGRGACGSISAAQWGWWQAAGVPCWLLPVQRGDVWHVVIRTNGGGVWEPSSINAGAA